MTKREDQQMCTMTLDCGNKITTTKVQYNAHSKGTKPATITAGPRQWQVQGACVIPSNKGQSFKIPLLDWILTMETKSCSYTSVNYVLLLVGAVARAYGYTTSFITQF